MALYDMYGNYTPDKKKERNPYAGNQNPYSANQNPYSQPTSYGFPEQDFNPDLSGWSKNIWGNQFRASDLVNKQLGFAQALEPSRQEAIKGLIQRLNNPQVMSEIFRMSQMGAGRDDGYRLGLQLMAQNPSAGNSLMQGATIDAANRAADSASAYDASLQSPEGQAAILQALLGAISQGQGVPGMDVYQGLTGLGLDASQLWNSVNQKKGGGLLGSILGTGLGLLTGGGNPLSMLGGLFGGGGGNADGASGTGQSQARRTR